MNLDRPDLYIGCVLGDRYEIREHQFTSSTGHIFTAQDTGALERRVAIKITFFHLTTHPQFLQRFTEETQRVAGLAHPNIVAIFDQLSTAYPPQILQALGTDHEPDQTEPSATGTLHFLVMELLDGAPLRQILRPGHPMPVMRALDLFHALASALAAAHSQGLLHRAVMPENIFITPTGQVKLSDFTLADFEQPHQYTQVEASAQPYIAPELLSSDQHPSGSKAKPRCDVYAAGIVFYEMLTGSLPHEHKTTAEGAASASLHAPVPSSLVSGLPPEVDHLVAQALHPDPDQRIASGAQLLHMTTATRAGRRPQPEQPTQALPAVPDHPPSTPREDNHTSIMNQTMSLPVVSVEDPSDASAQPDLPSTSRAATSRLSGFASALARRQTALAWTLVAAIILTAVVIAGFMLASVYGPLGSTPTPELVGQTRTQAELLILEKGLDAQVEQEFSETVPADEVLRTDPPAGVEVKKNSTITVVVSAGKERFEVPDLRGMTVDQARNALQEVSLTLGKENSTYTEIYPQGTILVSEPDAGRQVKRDTPVDITLSRGPGVMVPSLQNLPTQVALQQLLSEGFQAGELKQEFSSTVAQDAVINQSPEPGVRVAPGSSVTLTISQGPQLIAIPDVKGMPYQQAQRQLEEAGFQVNVTGTKFTGNVLYVSPGGGTQLPEGSTVTLLVP